MRSEECVRCKYLKGPREAFKCELNFPSSIYGERCQEFVCCNDQPETTGDAVNAPAHYVGAIECIDYLRDKLTPAEFTGFCIGNVLKYCSRWRKKDGLQDLKKAAVYLNWAIENEGAGRKHERR